MQKIEDLHLLWRMVSEGGEIMNNIIARLIYPGDFKLEHKDIVLREVDFNVLTQCNKIGSEGKYFEIEEMILEDTNAGISLTIMLK